MSQDLRFVRAVESSRPKRAHRFDVWSPKLSRHVILFGDRALQGWLAIESNPTIVAFCERPLVARAHKPPRVLDFWIARHDSEELWVIAGEDEWAGPGGAEEFDPALQIWARTEGMHLRIIKLEEIALRQVASDNWQMVLHYLAANRDLLTPALLESLKRACQSGETLHRLEHIYSEEDPILVRSALFSLLHQGVLRVEELQTVPLSAATRFTAA